MKKETAEKLRGSRRRTEEIISTVSDGDLYRQHDSLMSPIAWDLGHIGNFEELWGIRSLPDSEDLFPALDEMYDAVRNPRSTRSSLPLPPRGELLHYLEAIRKGVMEASDRVTDSGDPLLRDDFVYEMLHQHELQHQETIMQTLMLKHGEPYRPGVARRDLPEGDASLAGAFVLIPGGEFQMGTDRWSGVYDNERPSHRVSVEPFEIGVVPVTNGEYIEFMEGGGYQRRELWDPQGWSFITEMEITAPKYWQRVDGEWVHRGVSGLQPVDPVRPVCHICWYEAVAFARFRGARLPSETEWEFAAGLDPETGESLRYPWGNEEWEPQKANLDIAGWGTAQVGAWPEGVSRFGIHQMLGDVWEWTASHFTPYPGFEAFPYDEYSKIFFGADYRVLRGGSWVTAPDAIRATFRNWDYPIRRQIFSGLRLARSITS